MNKETNKETIIKNQTPTTDATVPKLDSAPTQVAAAKHGKIASILKKPKFTKATIIKVAMIALSLAVILLSVVSLLIGCSQDVDVSEAVNFFSGLDDKAPILVSVTSESSDVIRLEFSEPVKVFGSSFQPHRARSDGRSVYVELSSDLPPGKMSNIQGRVKDYSGNTCGFTVSVWGLNPRVPEILINEVTTKGSAKSPDRTELRVLTDGNLNGMAIYCGIPDDYDAKLIFGDIDVSTDDLVVVWWTESLPEDLPSSPHVVNICAHGSDNPSSNNGVIVLCDTPSHGARIIDALVYSNFSSSHGGFGTKSAEERARWVLSAGAWSAEAVDATSSTATRSISRWLNGIDTNTSDDWYITVTSGSTFGKPNTSAPLDSTT